jgi:hypothetical protein
LEKYFEHLFSEHGFFAIEDYKVSSQDMSLDQIWSHIKNQINKKTPLILILSSDPIWHAVVIVGYWQKTIKGNIENYIFVYDPISDLPCIGEAYSLNVNTLWDLNCLIKPEGLVFDIKFKGDIKNKGAIDFVKGFTPETYSIPEKLNVKDYLSRKNKEKISIDSRNFSLKLLLQLLDSGAETDLIGFLQFEDFVNPEVFKEDIVTNKVVTRLLVKDKLRIIKISKNNGILKPRILIEPNFDKFPGNNTNRLEICLYDNSISGHYGIKCTLVRFKEVNAQFLRVEFEKEFYQRLIHISRNEISKIENVQIVINNSKKINSLELMSNSEVPNERINDAKKRLFGKNYEKGKKNSVLAELSKKWRPSNILDLEADEFMKSIIKKDQESVVAYYPLNDYIFKNAGITLKKFRPIEEQNLLRILIKISIQYFSNFKDEQKVLSKIKINKKD